MGATLTEKILARAAGVAGARVGEILTCRVDLAYIGACVGAKLSDLRMAAEVLKGRKVAPGTRLLVAPASAVAGRIADPREFLA